MYDVSAVAGFHSMCSRFATIILLYLILGLLPLPPPPPLLLLFWQIVFFIFEFFAFLFSSFIYRIAQCAEESHRNQFNHVFINLPCEGQTKNSTHQFGKKRFSKYIPQRHTLVHTQTHTPSTCKSISFCSCLTNDYKCMNENETSRVKKSEQMDVYRCAYGHGHNCLCAMTTTTTSSVIRARPVNKDNLCEHARSLAFNRFEKLFMQSVFSVAVNGYRESTHTHTLPLPQPCHKYCSNNNDGFGYGFVCASIGVLRQMMMAYDSSVQKKMKKAIFKVNTAICH